MDIQGHNAILLTATTTIQDTLDMSKSISEYGILVVIAAIFLVVSFYILRRMINSYTNLIDEIIPKIEADTKATDNLKTSMNEMMSAHNAHTNQSLRSIERDTKAICENINQCHKSLTELGSSIKSLQANYDTLLKIVVGINGMANILPTDMRTRIVEDSIYRDTTPPRYNEIIYEREDGRPNKKMEEEESD